jgi:ABC-type multidrug transport system ATPase subunit
MSMKKKVAVGTAVLWDLGLSEVLGKLVGTEGHRGLSGGETKQVVIATALMTSMMVVFLDKPTTGLDASLALAL